MRMTDPRVKRQLLAMPETFAVSDGENKSCVVLASKPGTELRSELSVNTFNVMMSLASRTPQERARNTKRLDMEVEMKGGTYVDNIEKEKCCSVRRRQSRKAQVFCNNRLACRTCVLRRAYESYFDGCTK